MKVAMVCAIVASVTMGYVTHALMGTVLAWFTPYFTGILVAISTFAYTLAVHKLGQLEHKEKD